MLSRGLELEWECMGQQMLRFVEKTLDEVKETERSRRPGFLCCACGGGVNTWSVSGFFLYLACNLKCLALHHLLSCEHHQIISSFI